MQKRWSGNFPCYFYLLLKQRTSELLLCWPLIPDLRSRFAFLSCFSNFEFLLSCLRVLLAWSRKGRTLLVERALEFVLNSVSNAQFPTQGLCTFKNFPRSVKLDPAPVLLFHFLKLGFVPILGIFALSLVLWMSKCFIRISTVATQLLWHVVFSPIWCVKDAISLVSATHIRVSATLKAFQWLPDFGALSQS